MICPLMDPHWVRMNFPVDLRDGKPGQRWDPLSLPERMRELSIEDEQSEEPDGCPVTAMVPQVHTLCRAAAERSAQLMAKRQL